MGRMRPGRMGRMGRAGRMPAGATALAAALMLCTSAPVLGQAALPDADAERAGLWQAMTTADVEAAHRILREDHPGSAAEAGDAPFRQILQTAYRTARSRAAQVNSIAGYLATMQGFAAAMGDKHIWSRPLAIPVGADWAGLLIARRGPAWVVAAEDDAVEGPPLAGAALVSCDGVAADALAERRLGGFRAYWPIEAQRTATAPWLLIDDYNPFLTRPARCIFDQAGSRRDVELRWRTARRADLTGRFAGIVKRGAPGFGVRQSGEGYWIALESLSDRAGPIVEQVRAQADAIRRAPFVVLDLRGNGGGNSVHGERIAEVLLRPAAAPPPTADRQQKEACSVVWRATDRNIGTLRSYEERFGREMGPEAAAYWGRSRAAAEAARAADRQFSGPVSCDRRGAAAAREQRFPGRVVLLTDHACFSSCLLVTDRFRALGALHVGEATDAATRYFEVREDAMPSGLSMFSTLQALANGSDPKIGPFVPAILYGGDISDTQALERWVAALPQLRAARWPGADRGLTGAKKKRPEPGGSERSSLGRLK